MQKLNLFGSRVYPYTSSQNGRLVATPMWLEELLGDTDSLRLIKRYFAWFDVTLRGAQRQHKCEHILKIVQKSKCPLYTISLQKNDRGAIEVFFFLASACKTWHCCTNYLMPTNGNPPVTMTKKCLIIHIYVSGEELHISHTLQKPWTRSPRHPSRAWKLIPDTWYLAAVCFFQNGPRCMKNMKT